MRIAEPVRRVGHAEAAEDLVEGAGLGVEDPVPDDARDRDREDLRQVVRGPQDARRAGTHVLPDVVEQHGGEQEADQRRQHHHREDHPQRVLKGVPERAVVQQRPVVVQADPDLRGQPALPPVQRVPEVQPERDEDDHGERHGARYQVEPVDAPRSAAVGRDGLHRHRDHLLVRREWGRGVRGPRQGSGPRTRRHHFPVMSFLPDS
ncbi:hypothetical protein GALL_409470 [mine drainage metagenome]|uniref:Uncharacterized protein n=1 Tax=mine drainage metagenome TaxID=410659 RepID=A0A1J5QMX8_9ZZZZ